MGTAVSLSASSTKPVSKETALFEYLLRLGDDRLILGHRLSEWCGHGPILEEDLALANVALDLVGHAQAFLALAGKVEGKERSEDILAFFRDVREFRCVKLVELPKGDFAFTVARQFLFDCFAALQSERLQSCKHEELAGIAAKCFKEDSYHLRHSAQWVIRLGDGTEESHRRIQSAIVQLWPYTGELFMSDDVDQTVVAHYGAPNPEALKAKWREQVESVFKEATLSVPADGWAHSGGRKGLHTEALGHLLAEMQSVPRAHPTARW